jgi:hypothetical protein
MDTKQEPSGRKEPNLGQKEAEIEKSEKQHQTDEHGGRKESKDTPQSEATVRKHRQVRP